MQQRNCKSNSLIMHFPLITNHNQNPIFQWKKRLFISSIVFEKLVIQRKIAAFFYWINILVEKPPGHDRVIWWCVPNLPWPSYVSISMLCTSSHLTHPNLWKVIFNAPFQIFILWSPFGNYKKFISEDSGHKSNQNFKKKACSSLPLLLLVLLRR